MGRGLEGGVTAVAAVLLVPTEAHRGALIGDGPCGSRAPVALQSAIEPYPWMPTSRSRPRPTTKWTNWYTHGALVLAWDGKPVPDGLARLAALIPGPAEDGVPVRWTVAVALYRARTIAEVCAAVQRLREYAASAEIGRFLFLDADRREVVS